MRFNVAKNKKIIAAVLVVAACGVYYLSPASRIFSPLRRPIAAVGGIFFNAGNGLHGFWEGLTQGQRFAREFKEQALALSAALSETARLRYLEQENEELRALLDFKNNAEARVVTAQIISRNNEFGISTVTINRGGSHGIIAGLPAIGGKGVLIGKVHRVFPSSATILLAADSESTLAVSFAAKPEIQAIASGNLGISLRMELIPQDVEVGIGDIVVSSALEDHTPHGLIVGRVAEIEYREGELFQTAQLEPVLSVAHLSTLAIMLPPQDE